MALTKASETVARCSMTREYTYTLTWCPEKNYVAGTRIELRSWKLRSFHTWKYVRMHVDGADTEFRWKVKPSASELRTNPNRVVLRARFPYGVKCGQHVTITLSMIPPIYAGVNERLSVWILDVPNNFRPDAEPPEPYAEPGSTCELEVIAGAVDRLSVYSRPLAGRDRTVRTRIVPEDRFGNPSSFENRVHAEITWSGKTQAVPVLGTTAVDLPQPSKTDRVSVSVGLEELSPRETLSNGTITGNRSIVDGNPVIPDRLNGFIPAFGEFHWHTDFSGDGQRPILEALRCARDELNMDYCAPGDHAPQGDAWDQTVKALDEFHRQGEFATFFGWEFGGDRGHENYYFTDPDHPMKAGGEAGITGGHPEEIRDAASRFDQFIGIPHHTNSVAETRRIEDDSPFWHPYPWSDPVPYIRLVEIMQGRGNHERNEYDDSWRGFYQNNGSSAQDALARGYRVGFTGGTDNHSGWAGRAFIPHEGAGVHGPKSVILTGVWTTELDRQPVFDALYARRTWAVWDTRAVVWFEVHGCPMGDEVTVKPGVELTSRVNIWAESPFKSIEIISEGTPVWTGTSPERDIDLTISLGTMEKATHFYLRAMLHNGGIIYASPVFVDLA